MKKIPDRDVFTIITNAEALGYKVCYDSFGELVIHTNIFKWTDHHYRNVSEDEFVLTKKLNKENHSIDYDDDEYDDIGDNNSYSNYLEIE